MISVHDTKGKFGVGFMVINDDRPKLAIFDDDRKVLATMHEKQMSLDFIDSVIKNKGYKSRIKYQSKDEVIPIPVVVQSTPVEGQNFENFVKCRGIIESGIFPKEGTQMWRREG